MSGSAPLSDSQRGVWVAQRLDPASPAYHTSLLWRLDGPLDVDALRAAIVAVTARHAAMRTRFVQAPGEEPRQRFDAEPSVDVERVVVDAVDDRALVEAARERASRPFDLLGEGLIRWTLFERGPRRHALLLVWHHIASDGVSTRVVGEDIARAYGELAAGRPAALTPPGSDYAGFARWQQDPAQAAARAEDLAWWKARLDGAPTLALPIDYHRAPSRSLRGAVVKARLSLADVDALKALRHEAKASPLALFLTAYVALLARHAGQDEVVVGVPVAARPPGYADVVGFFASVIPCRLDLRGAPSSLAAAVRAYASVHDGAAHGGASVPRIAEAMKLPRDAARQPLFQVAFGMNRSDMLALPLPGLEVESIDLGIGHARFDLMLNLVDGPDGVDMSWHYAADLFARSTIERLARHYATLVRAMAREPGAPLDSLPLMDVSERDRVVASGVGRATPIVGEEVVHRRFAAQAAARPQARAIGALGYGALEACANRLAQELLTRGVKPGRFVAVAREKAADLSVAWLAVLKCGAAYVPIDTTLPDARLGAMLADAGVAHAIVDEACAYKLKRDGIDVVRPEAEAARIAAHAAIAPEVAVGAEDAAYAIYTSGSTGRPKGVVVPHRAIVSLVVDNDYAPLGPEDVVAQMAPAAFDASTFEIWGPLLNGASIAPIAKATAMSPRALAAAIEKERVTTLFLTTALFDAVAREVPGAFGPCRTVLFGGEACDARRVEAVLKAGGPKRLVHVYGPTETTTFATYHEVGEVEARATTVPIGRAIARSEAYVLRADGEPCAPGEPGEVVIGGRGVALGYLKASEAEASRFVVAPVGDLPPRRLYRSGDRARLDEDGRIAFLGRVDDQVKVLGHRIELGEVEAAIARHPGVREVACVLRGDSSDTRRIVAYAVPANPAAAPPDDLRKMLRGVLPLAMLPAEIAWVPALPLNASGKVDRRALADGVASPLPVRASVVAPRTPLELDLLERWKRLLGQERLGITDRFFDAGGTSLLAVRMIDEYERDTGIALPLAAMFVDDTVAGLARAIARGSLAENAEVAPLHEHGTRTPFVFAHGDFLSGGFHSHSMAQRLGADQPIYAVHPHGLVGGGVPETIEAMAADRLRALRELRPHGPYVVGGHCNGAFIAFELARQLVDAGESVPAVIVIDAPAPTPDLDPAVREASIRDAMLLVEAMTSSLRTQDLAVRLKRAMSLYRAPRLPTHLVYVRSEDEPASAGGASWLSLAATAEVRVIPGVHRTLVVRDGGAQLCDIVREVIDRSMAAAA